MIHYQSQSGFTLVEMLVSLTLFTIVATVATGTLLSLIGSNSRLVAEQTVMSGLSFALDSMSREIRTGSEYRCNVTTEAQADSVANSASNATLVDDCASGATGLSFREGGRSITAGVSAKRIAYYLGPDPDNTSANTILRQVGTNEPQALIDSREIQIVDFDFYIEGTEPLTVGATPVNVNQPSVTIVIRARSTDTDLDREFVVQTSITQRALDI